MPKIELLLLAAALGTDAFSLCLGLGLAGMSRRRAEALIFIVTALVIGLVAGLMTAAGFALGRRVGNWAGRWAHLAGGAVLVGVGVRLLA